MSCLIFSDIFRMRVHAILAVMCLKATATGPEIELSIYLVLYRFNQSHRHTSSNCYNCCSCDSSIIHLYMSSTFRSD